MKRRNLVLAGPGLLVGGLGLTLPLAARAQSAVVKFGQSASLTGGQAAYGKDVQDGIAAAFAAANKAEGAKGLRFELVTLDDGGDKERCKQNVKTLIDQGVSALLGLTSGAAAEAAVPLSEEAQIAMLGTASGNMGIRSPKFTTAYHVRAGYDEEYRRMVQYVKDYGFTRVGYVYLKDTTQANQLAMTAALDAVGVKPSVTIALDRNAKGFEAETKQLLDGKLDCVLFTTNAGPINKIVDLMHAARYPGLYFSSSFAGQVLIDDMAKKGISVIMTQVVPRPHQVALPVVKQYQSDLAALNGARQGYTSFEGYIAGLVAVEATRAAAKSGGTGKARLREALAGLRTDLGGYKINFTGSSTRTASRFVEVVALDRYGRVIG
jgi:ABC-type branched-subunit amino acid transport system substrate-binding protein